MDAVHTGQTNITRVLTILMQYPAQWQGTQIEVNPLSQPVKDEFSAPGRMTLAEISHIENQWPMDQKQDLLTHVLNAIEVDRPMVFKWGLTSGPELETDIVWPPDGAPPTAPVLVTFRSPRAGVAFTSEPERSPGHVVIQK